MPDSPLLSAPSGSVIPAAASPLASESRSRGWLLALLVCAAFVAATAPTLYRLEFFDGVERINLVTVLELRRDGGTRQWLMPELEGDPRTVKPPLTAWVTAAAVTPATIGGLASRDPAVREAAFRRFVRECRWPSLALHRPAAPGRLRAGPTPRRLRPGRRLAGRRASVLVCASCLLFLRQGRRATTDLQLALWVTVTNAFLARLIFERRNLVRLPRRRHGARAWR